MAMATVPLCCSCAPPSHTVSWRATIFRASLIRIIRGSEHESASLLDWAAGPGE